MKKSIIALLVGVFIAGVFIGIWIDWSAWKTTARVRQIAYELDDSQVASLRVHTGDTISIVTAEDGSATDPGMKFVANNVPCEDPKTPNTCVISANAKHIPYFFNCTSANGVGCADPGIQPSLINPLDFSFAGTVKTDFSQLVGIKSAPREQLKPPPANAAHAPIKTTTAIIGCSEDTVPTTTLSFRNDSSANAMPVSLGESVFWFGSSSFTISGLPNDLCKKGNPSGTNDSGRAKCDIDPSFTVPASKTVSYQVQQSQCGSAATQATLQFQ